jgi:hypothetical protein
LPPRPEAVPSLDPRGLRPNSFSDPSRCSGDVMGCPFGDPDPEGITGARGSTRHGFAKPLGYSVSSPEQGDIQRLVTARPISSPEQRDGSQGGVLTGINRWRVAGRSRGPARALEAARGRSRPRLGRWFRRTLSDPLGKMMRWHEAKKRWSVVGATAGSCDPASGGVRCTAAEPAGSGATRTAVAAGIERGIPFLGAPPPALRSNGAVASCPRARPLVVPRTKAAPATTAGTRCDRKDRPIGPVNDPLFAALGLAGSGVRSTPNRPGGERRSGRRAGPACESPRRTRRPAASTPRPTSR